MKIEVSNGEILDKITILAIKKSIIKDKDKLINIHNEFNTLVTYFNQIVNTPEIGDLYYKLQEINSKIWEAEDVVRDKERNKIFDQEFIDTARSIYYLNDERALVKREINVLSESGIIEEKSYEDYK
jgi:hypothetical protein